MADWAGIYQLRGEQFQDKDALERMADPFPDWGDDFYFMSGCFGLAKQGRSGLNLSQPNNDLEETKGLVLDENTVSPSGGYCAQLSWKGDQLQLLLREDIVGSHPIYYSRQGDRFLFSTDLKSLILLPTIAIRPNPQAINETLTLGGAVGSNTLFRSVYRVGAGHAVELKDGAVEKYRYWSPSPPTNLKRGKPKQLLDIITQQVKACAAGEETVTVPLSGGIDSSLLVDILSRETEASVKTFTLTFQEVDESDFASRIARRYQTEHKQVNLDPDISNSVRQIWNVPNDLPYFHLHLLDNKLAPISEGAGRIFQGEGPDGLLKTSKKIKRANMLRNLRLPRQLFAGDYTAHLPLSWEKLLEFLTARGRYEKLAALFTWLNRREREEVYGREFQDFKNDFSSIRHLFRAFSVSNLSNQRSYLLLHTFLANHLLEANTLLIARKRCQAVYPYLGPTFINKSFTINPRSKLDKLIFKQACLSRLPSDIVKRRKTGFGHYMRALVQRHWPIVENYLHRLARRQYFSERGIKKIIKRRKKSQVFFRQDQWSYDNRVLDFLFGLEIWFETFIDPSSPRKLKKL